MPLSPPASFKDTADTFGHEDLSDYIQHHRIQLPDLEETSADSEEIEEEFQSIYTAATQDDSSWSENWTMRRRNRNRSDDDATAVPAVVTKAISPPVGMLVPSPTHDIKTQIGDQNADEISDLSEAGSDDDGDDEYVPPSIDVPHVLVESKTRIGGKNEAARIEHDLFEVASLVSDSSLPRQSPLISEARNELLLCDDNGNERTASVAHMRRDAAADAKYGFEPIPAPR